MAKIIIRNLLNQRNYITHFIKNSKSFLESLNAIILKLVGIIYSPKGYNNDKNKLINESLNR